MKVLSNLEFKNSTYILNKFNDFPENPVEGMTIFKENGLYIYSINISSGNLEWLNILDFTRVNSSFKFEQTTENIEWNITHNLNTQDLFVIVYDSDGNKQIESEIQFQSDNEIKLIFSEPISGKALVFGASVVSSPSNMYTKEEIDELLKNIEVSGGSGNIILPDGGSDGYLLSKNGDELGWTNPADVGTKLPEDGLPGQILSLNKDEDLTWSNPKAPVKLNVGDLVYTFADTPPANTLFCDSSILDKNSYPELYSVIGDTFTGNNLTSSDRLIVPHYDYNKQSEVITDITSDLTLDDNSYHSAILNGNIKITTVGPSGGVYRANTRYLGWFAFHNYDAAEYGMWQTDESSSPSYLEIEFLDKSKFALYKYGLNRYYNWPCTEWTLLAYDESSQEWIELDKQENNPLVNGGTIYYFDIANYDNTKCYNKFRIYYPTSTIQSIYRIYLYGTKEGEASIYDGFALPPSSTNESGAKACIVHSSHTIDNPSVYSTDEQIVGTWINGKPIYRKTFTDIIGPSVLNVWQDAVDVSNLNIELALKFYGTSIIEDYHLPINSSGSNGKSFTQAIYRISSKTIQIINAANTNCTNHITIEYTKTTD